MSTLLSPLCESLESRVFLAAVPNDPALLGNQLYGLNRVGAPSVWSITTGSSTVAVANIDSGIDYAHPDLYLNIYLNQGELPFPVGPGGLVESKLDADRIITFRDLNARNPDGSLINGAFVSDLNKNGYIDGEDLVFDPRWSNGVDNDGNGYVDDLVGWDFADNDNDPYDTFGHGTHTAGTIGAIGNNSVGVIGMNWDVQIMALKIFGDHSGGASSEAVANAIYYAVNQGARVSNNSYGGSFGQTGDIIYNAISYANQHGHLFVTAAGNAPINNDFSPSRTYPASYDLPNIISVAASDANDRLAGYSSFGLKSVDIAAPGNNILSTVPGGYGHATGTSMAAPHVAGAAALLFAMRPNFAAWQVKYALMLSVDKTPSLRYTVFSGGRLNVARAAMVADGFKPVGHQHAALARMAVNGSPIRPSANMLNVQTPLDLLAADDESDLLMRTQRIA